jgi:hypothetical protein
MGLGIEAVEWEESRGFNPGYGWAGWGAERGAGDMQGE